MTQICRDFQSRVYYKWILSQPCVCVCYFALLERGSELQKQIGRGKILGDSDGRNENHFESSLKKTFLLSKVIGFSSFEKDSYAIASSSNLWKKGNYTHRKMENAERLSPVYHLFSLSCSARNGSQYMWSTGVTSAHPQPVVFMLFMMKTYNPELEGTEEQKGQRGCRRFLLLPPIWWSGMWSGLSTRSPEVMGMCTVPCMDLYVPGLLREIRFCRVILLC